MRFSRKLYAAFATCTALILAVGAFSCVQIERLSSHTHAITSNWMPSVQLLLSIKADLADFRVQELQLVAATESAQQKAREQRLDAIRERAGKLQADYARLISSPAERARYEAFSAKNAERMKLHEQLRQARLANQVDELVRIDPILAKLRNEAGDELEKLSELNAAGAQAEVGRSNAAASLAQRLLPVALLLALLTSAALSWSIVRGTMRELGAEPSEAKRVVARIASGNLAEPVPVGAGDTTSLLAAMQAMQRNLAQLVGQIADGAAQIRTASEEVARGNLDLSSRTEQQAASLQETASSMEQITSNVRQSTQSAEQATTLAKLASDNAERGQQTIRGVVATMQDIAHSSARVENIIGVIDGIAFQTNILALNAAVEAARAGEQGRGFAVVASEVRSLAQRSADAAREIKGLIGAAAAKVAEGNAQVGAAGEAMAGITQAIAKAADMIAEISAASTEQLLGIEQVNRAVVQLDTVTQQNAALVEQASAATQSMTDQSGRLAAAVQQFRVERGSSAPVHAAGGKPTGTMATPRGR